MMGNFEQENYEVDGGHEIRIAQAGPSDGPALIFIHGSGPGASAISNFSQNIDAFTQAGFRVILPDLIGYGQSSKPEGIDYTLDLFVDTLMQALELHGLKRATLIGNSLGGGIAIQIALNNPEFVDRLILMAPGCIEERETYFSMPGIAKMVSDFGSADFSIEDQRRVVCNLVYDSSSVTDTLVQERFAVARTQPKDVLARMKTPNLQPRLGELKHPIMVLWGVNDEFCPETGSRYFLNQCDNARCISFTQVGHWVQVERPEEFNSYAIEFLHD